MNDQEFDVIEGETFIARVYGTGTQTIDGANASLIAAAPELLDALAIAANLIKANAALLARGTAERVEHERVLQIIRVAQSKADSLST